MFLRSALSASCSVVAHASVLLLLWWHPWPSFQPPPPPDGSPVSLAAFDYDDAPEVSSTPTPASVATPPDEAPPAPVHVTATAEPLPDPMGMDAAPDAPTAKATETGQGEKAADETKKGDTISHGAKSKNPRKTPKPCPEPVADIEQLGPMEWFVQRELVEYYAAHIAEIENLASVWTHVNPAGDADGFRLGLPRCTVLRDGGLRSGDIVHDINGIHINNVLQAVSAYLRLRKEPILRLHLTRKKEDVTLSYHLEQKDRKKKKDKANK